MLAQALLVVVDALLRPRDKIGWRSDRLHRGALSAMKRSSDTKAQFPHVDVWPGDRDERDGQIPNPDQFIVSYPLRDGCQACARAGGAIFSCNFDAAGKFLETSFQRNDRAAAAIGLWSADEPRAILPVTETS